MNALTETQPARLELKLPAELCRHLEAAAVAEGLPLEAYVLRQVTRALNEADQRRGPQVNRTTP